MSNASRTKRTPKQRVLKKYPKAGISLDSFDAPKIQFNVLASFMEKGTAILGMGATHEEAWADAARKL